MDVKNQNFLVLGVSKSGYAAAEYLLTHGGNCKIIEENKTEKTEQAALKLIELGAQKISADQIDDELNGMDVLILSPGVPINHPIAVKAKQKGVRIMGELEFGYSQFFPKIVAVTGTNGKTTTVNLIDAILKEGQIKSQMVGNVGVPLTEKVDSEKDTVFVTEVSSFQLESVSAFCPHVSCILNISPDHLERHYSMENYVFLKKRIFKNQRESEYSILNFDDNTVREFYPEIKAKVKWVSLKEEVDGAYLKDGKLYYSGEYVMDESALKLKGEHNVCDALFAIAVAKILGVENQYISAALSTFKGVKHRLEYVANKNGVDFYNDSKATNTASTISALSVMTAPTVLILGGSEKGEKYGELFEKIKSSAVKHAILTGAARYNLLDAAAKKGFGEVTVTGSFDSAVKIAALLACEGDSVLLSPACASFDSFSGYAERGERFIKIVEEL